MSAHPTLIELETNVGNLTTNYAHAAAKLNNQPSIVFDAHHVSPLIRAMRELIVFHNTRYDQHRKEINELEKQNQYKDFVNNNQALDITKLEELITELRKSTNELMDRFNKERTKLQEQNSNLQARLLDLENKLTIKDHTIRRLDHEKQELAKQVQKLEKLLKQPKPITREMLKIIEQKYSHKYENAPPEPCSFEELVGEPMSNHTEFMQQVIEEMESPETIAQFAPTINQESKPISQPVTQFSTGAVRSTDANSTRYDLISPVGLRRIAETYAEGAAKYGDNNWTKGMPASDTMNHALRHLNLWLSGDRSEDHLAHAAWNLIAIMHFEELKPDCIDVPTRRTT